MNTTAPAAVDADASIAWFARECRRNGVGIDRHVRTAKRAGDREMAEFFRRAQREAHKLTKGAPR